MNIENLIRKNILQMAPYASARDEFKDFTKTMIYLDANESPFSNGLNRYPDPYQLEVKKKIAANQNFPADQILLGNGSDEVLDLLFRAFCEPNIDNVITLPPTYGMYSVLANLNAIENREVLLDSTMEPNVEEILKNVNSNTKILFLCSPNNPTGNSFSEEKISFLLQNFPGIVVIDEAYIDFSEKESWLQKIKDFPNLVVSQTFSKAYGMAGIRLGIVYASLPVVTILNKIKPPYNINLLTQQQILDLDFSVIRNQIVEIQRLKQDLIKVLLEVKSIVKVYPSDANFILVQVQDADKLYALLLENGIVVRNRSKQPLCENTLRITVGTAHENEKLITVLQTI